MKKPPVDMLFDRDFQLWFYTPSHSQLLLRSNKKSKVDKRIDVAFFGVEAIDCPTLMHGKLVIQEVECKELSSRYPQTDRYHQNIKRYWLQGDCWEGYILAYNISCKEDDGDYSEPSSINMELDISVTSGMFRKEREDTNR
jgi:hypothetical protein